jgi:hypothetical protein
MRTLRLAKAAAQAEGMRLREMARRQARRAAIAVAALFFFAAFLVAGHVAIVMALVPTVTPVRAVLIVGGGDLLIALVLALIASSSRPGALEREATELGQRMRQEIHDAMTVPSILGGAARLIGVERLLKLVLAMIRGRADGRKEP